MHDAIDQIQIERKSFECSRLFILSGWKCLTEMNDREDNPSVRCPEMWLIISKHRRRWIHRSHLRISGAGWCDEIISSLSRHGRSTRKVNWMRVCKIMVWFHFFFQLSQFHARNAATRHSCKTHHRIIIIHVFTHTYFFIIYSSRQRPTRTTNSQLASQKMKIAISWMKSRFVWIAFSGSEWP